VDTCSVRRGTRLTIVKGARANAIAKRRIGGNGWINCVGSKRRRYVNSIAIAAVITIYISNELDEIWWNVVQRLDEDTGRLVCSFLRFKVAYNKEIKTFLVLTYRTSFSILVEKQSEKRIYSDGQ